MDQTIEQTNVQPDVQTTTTLASDQTQPETKLDFKSLIPDEYKNEKSLQNFQDVGSLVKSFLHSQKLVGLDKIPIPNKHATQNEWDEVYKRLGKPEKPDGYKYNLSKENKLDQNALKAFSEKAHSLGLLPSQADGIIQYYNELAKSSETDVNAKAETARLESEQTLRQEFGPSYNTKLTAAKNLASATLGNEFLNSTTLADGSKLGDNPIIVKAFASLAEKLSEDVIVKGDSPSYMTNKEIDEQIDKIRQPGSAYWQKDHPNHDKAVAEALALQELKANG